jgi:hypothetical protein
MTRGGAQWFQLLSLVSCWRAKLSSENCAEKKSFLQQISHAIAPHAHELLCLDKTAQPRL